MTCLLHYTPFLLVFDNHLNQYLDRDEKVVEEVKRFDPQSRFGGLLIHFHTPSPFSPF